MNTSNKNEAADLLIVGAGVAGSAVALACVTKLRKIVILHADDERQGAESLSPDACERLSRHSIDVGSPFSSVHAWWGSDRVAESPCPGARIVQRKELAEAIRARAEGSAMTVNCKSIVALTRSGGTWCVVYRDPAGSLGTIATRNVCDATGRRSAIGRLLGARRVNLDNLCCAAVPVPGFSLVGTWTEAVSNGWWNLCSDGTQGTLAFYSAPKILKTAIQDLKRLLAETKEMQRMICLDHPWGTRIRICSSSFLSPCAGPGWFAVGDAAMTTQPLASAGIGKALRDSRLALRLMETDGTEYSRRYHQEFADYAKSLAAQYKLERRWKDSEFWSCCQKIVRNIRLQMT